MERGMTDMFTPHASYPPSVQTITFVRAPTKQNPGKFHAMAKCFWIGSDVMARETAAPSGRRHWLHPLSVPSSWNKLLLGASATKPSKEQKQLDFVLHTNWIVVRSPESGAPSLTQIHPPVHTTFIPNLLLQHTCTKHVNRQGTQHLIREVDRLTQGLVFLHLLQDQPVQDALRVLGVHLLLQKCKQIPTGKHGRWVQDCTRHHCVPTWLFNTLTAQMCDVTPVTGLVSTRNRQVSTCHQPNTYIFPPVELKLSTPHLSLGNTPVENLPRNISIFLYFPPQWQSKVPCPENKQSHIRMSTFGSSCLWMQTCLRGIPIKWSSFFFFFGGGGEKCTSCWNMLLQSRDLSLLSIAWPWCVQTTCLQGSRASTRTHTHTHAHPS